MKKNLTELVFILDRSGSMQGMEGDTIGGFNAMLEKQKLEPGQAFVSTILFDDRTQVLHDRVKVGEVRPITRKEYYAGDVPLCWTLWAELFTTLETSTSMPAQRMCRNTPFLSSPPMAWRTPAAAIPPSRSKR